MLRYFQTVPILLPSPLWRPPAPLGKTVVFLWRRVFLYLVAVTACVMIHTWGTQAELAGLIEKEVTPMSHLLVFCEFEQGRPF